MLNSSSLSDKQIRKKLIELLGGVNAYNDTVIIEELDLCQGEARIDLVIINGTATGIEIKSDKDNLDRLPSQIPVYNRIFDYIEIVIGKKHIESTFDLVPTWWGISLMTEEAGTIEHKKIRPYIINRNKDAFSVSQLLWKNEALKLLENETCYSSLKYKNRAEIWTKLVECTPKETLFQYVNSCLKNRLNWRFDLPLEQDDG